MVAVDEGKRPGGGWWLPALFLIDALAAGSVSAELTLGPSRDFQPVQLVWQWAFLLVPLLDVWGGTRRAILAIAWAIALSGVALSLIPGDILWLQQGAALLLISLASVLSIYSQGYLGGVVRRLTQVRYAVFGGTFFAVVMILAYGLYPKVFPAASTPPRYGMCALVFLLLPLLYRYLPARLTDGRIQRANAWRALKHAARAAMTKRTALLQPR